MQESDAEPMSVLIACGGTGGHLFPGIAVAEELRERGHTPILLISEKQIDTLASQGYGHLRFERIPGMGMPKPWSPKMIPFVKSFLRASGLVKGLIRETGAKAVLGMGGFTSTAPLLTARRNGCLSLIHESNAIPGKANRLNAKVARHVLTGWEACRKFFPADKVEVTGTPVRPTLLKLPETAAAREEFGLDPNRFTLLVMGGSQGARGINDAVLGMPGEFDPSEIQILHITGPADYDSVVAGYEGAAIQSKVLPFLQEMEKAYAASDLAIGRSGASSLTEMSVVGLPGILVPYPWAAEDHQSRNAEVFTAKDACVVVKQDDLNAKDLADLIRKTGLDREKLQQMSDQMKALAPNDAAARICDLIEADGKN